MCFCYWNGIDLKWIIYCSKSHVWGQPVRSAVLTWIWRENGRDLTQSYENILKPYISVNLKVTINGKDVYKYIRFSTGKWNHMHCSLPKRWLINVYHMVSVSAICIQLYVFKGIFSQVEFCLIRKVFRSYFFFVFKAKTEVPKDVWDSKVRKQDKFRRHWSQH